MLDHSRPGPEPGSGPGQGPFWTSLPEVLEPEGFGPAERIVIEGDDEVSQRVCVSCVRCVRETGGRESVDPLLVRMGGTRSSRWAYVGEGQGHFEKGQSYAFVGEGAGAFEKDVAGGADWSMRKPCGVLLLLLAVPLLAFLVLSVTGKDQVLSVGREVAGHSPLTPVGTPAYRCASGEAWTPEEKEFCCRSPGGRCTTTLAPSLSIADSTEFNCDLGARRWRLAWPTKKKLWCCSHRQLGCLPGMPRKPPPTPAPSPSPAPAPPPPPPPAPPAREAPSDPAPSSNAEPPASKATAAPERPGTTPPPHDCKSGAEEDWPKSKRKWCCKAEGRGCPDSYDCLQSYFNWKVAWSERKRAWCCKHEEKACPGG